MGQYPVLFISLKDVKGLDFSSARAELAHTLLQKVRSFSYLLNSPKLSDFDKSFLTNCSTMGYLKNPENFDVAKKFLTYMVQILAKHYERQVILLIDEYDVPLQKSIKAGYYKQMLEFMQSFLSLLKSSSELKVDDRQALRKTILTGCLRVSKASIFTDVNNFDVDSVCSQGSPLSATIGFTESEVKQLLEYYDLGQHKSTVKQWYDGYHIGNSEIYCPWDVIRFCDDIQSPAVDKEKFVPENYWADTSSNEVIEEFLGFLSSADADRMQTLMDGNEINLKINEQLTYGDFKKHRSGDFWTLLLFTGYLTVTARPERDTYRLRIPNDEIRETFKTRIESYFSDANATYVNYANSLANAAFEGDWKTLQIQLATFLRRYVSVRDAATRANAENYYHGMLLGLLGNTESVENLQSNHEAGDGFADLIFTSIGSDIGVVFEIKHCQSVNEMSLFAEKALNQIQEKHYVQGFDGYSCSKIYGYGIAFCRKACIVAVRDFSSQSS